MEVIVNVDHAYNMPKRNGVMWDLATSEDVRIEEGKIKIIPLGIRMKLPEGYFGLMVPRSSACLKRGIVMSNSIGIIENDYCGQDDVWGFSAYAIRDTYIKAGTRIAQFMAMKYPESLEFNEVDSMNFENRGGFGSTGEGNTDYVDHNGTQLRIGDIVSSNISSVRAGKSRHYVICQFEEDMNGAIAKCVAYDNPKDMLFKFYCRDLTKHMTDL